MQKRMELAGLEITRKLKQIKLHKEVKLLTTAGAICRNDDCTFRHYNQCASQSTDICSA
jgi:hypothetical protein